MEGSQVLACDDRRQLFGRVKQEPKEASALAL